MQHGSEYGQLQDGLGTAHDVVDSLATTTLWAVSFSH